MSLAKVIILAILVSKPIQLPYDLGLRALFAPRTVGGSQSNTLNAACSNWSHL